MFKGLFGKKQSSQNIGVDEYTESAPPLTDSDMEFLFGELLEGVNQSRGQSWAQKWLKNLEYRITNDEWTTWLNRYGDKVLSSNNPNNDLAAKLIQLGELGIGDIGDAASDIGMQILTRNEPEPIWEYNGPDNQGVSLTITENQVNQSITEEGEQQESQEQEYQPITIEELYQIMQQDGEVRQQIATQLGIETDDPDIIIQALMQQFYLDAEENQEAS
jgi:hypothetical protein